MSDTLDGLVADPNLPGSYAVAMANSNLPVPEVAPVVQAVAVTAGVPETVVQAVAPVVPGAVTEVEKAVQEIKNPSPGNQTSEYRIAVAVCTFLSVASALFVALSGSGVFHLSPEVTAAVPSVASVVIGWVTTNYVNSRTAVKVATSTPKA